MNPGDLTALKELFGTFLPVEEMIRLYKLGFNWLFGVVLVPSTLIQLVMVLVAFLAARAFAVKIRKWMEWMAGKKDIGALARKLFHALTPLALPVVWLLLQWFGVLAARGAGWPHHLNTIVISLLTAWVVIRASTTVVADPALSRLIARGAWAIAALNTFDLLDDAIALMESAALDVGETRISLLTVIKGGLYLTAALWAAGFLSRVMDRQIGKFSNITPSLKVLLGKLLKFILLVTAILMALSAVGIDLTAFAVFTGAMGVGIGFGLQKIVANMISGFILLMDRSIKPGDVIAINNTYGWVKTLGARFTSVITRDGIEHLIPNEELITQRVENWSFSHDLVRVRIPIGVSYQADVPQAILLCKEAAVDAPRVLKEPAPVCNMMGFGESSIDLELRIWISDPQKGIANVRHGVLLRVWQAFRENQVEVPFPQRDLNIRQPAEFTVRLDDGKRAPGRKQAEEKAAPPPPAPEPTDISQVEASMDDSTEEQILLLSQIPLFKGLTVEERAFLAGRMVERSFQPGDPVIRQEEPGSTMFILADGSLAVHVSSGEGEQEETIEAGQIAPGDFFGERSLLTGEKRSATVIATSASSAWEIEKPAMADLLEKSPGIGEILSRTMALREVENSEALARRNPEEQEEIIQTTTLSFLEKLMRFLGR